jgi:hypothetical protein
VTADLFFSFSPEKSTFLSEQTEKSPAIELGFFYNAVTSFNRPL